MRIRFCALLLKTEIAPMPFTPERRALFVLEGTKWIRFLSFPERSNLFKNLCMNSPTVRESGDTWNGMWKRGITKHNPSSHCICSFSSVCYLQAGIHMPPHIPPPNTQKPISRFHHSLRIGYKPENEWRISTRTGRVCHEWRYSVICFSHTSAMPLNWM